MSSMNSVNDRLADAEQDDSYNGYAIGYVHDNNDPIGIARIKVRIANVFDTDQGPVPWCLPTKKSPFGQGPGYGVYGSPKVGSPVRISFQNGDPNYPIYECDEYLASHANPKFKEPDTWGYKDPAGNELYVNMQTGQWEWTHQSGDTIKYDGDGNVVVYVKKNSTTNIDGNESTTIQGNETRQVQGTLNFTVVGDVTINAQQNVTANVGGNLDVDVGGVTNLSSSGAVNISGATVNLN